MGASWITPKEDYDSNNGWGFADANAINNNLDYIYNTGIKPNTDALWKVGRSAIGNVFSDWATHSHVDRNNTTDFGVGFSSTGATIVNSAALETVSFRNANTEKMSMGSFGLNVLTLATFNNKVIINNTSGSSNGLTINNSLVNYAAASFISTSEIGTNYGVLVEAGSNVVDYCMRLNDKDSNNIATFRQIGSEFTKLATFNDHIILNTTTGASNAFQVNNSLVNYAAAAFFSDSGLGTTYGIHVKGGSNEVDYSARFDDKDGNNILLIKQSSVDFAKQINPTTTPTESTPSALTTSGSTYTVPRGQYHIYLKLQITTSGAATELLTLQRNIDGSWVNQDIIEESTVALHTLLTSGLQDSTGSDLRVLMTNSAGGVSSGTIVLRKY